MDKILETIDPFGKYQKLSVLLIGCLSSFSAATIYSTIFTTAEPKFICYKNNLLVENASNCEIWSNISKSTNNTYNCEYDKTYYGKTIINEWNLICDRKYLSSLTQTFYMIGSFLAIFTGYLGDRYGRKRTIIGTLTLIFLTLFISQLIQIESLNISFLTRYIIYLIAQMMIGLLTITLYCISYILLLENTTNRYHVLFSIINLYAYIIGELIVLIIAYFSKDWKLINRILTVYSFIFIIPCALLLKESPRLLARRFKYDEAIVVLKEISKFNSCYNKNDIDQDKIYKQMLIDENKLKTDNFTHNGNFFQEFLFGKKLFFQAILLSYIWISLNLLYYGVTLGITEYNNSINPYLTYLLSSIAEFAGYSICFLNDRFGRRKTNIVYLLVTGFVCLIVSFLPYLKTYLFSYEEIFVVTLTLIGKCTTAASYNTCYLYSSELYKSNIRSSALLFLSCFGRIGSLIAPQINLLSSIVWKPLPYIIFSIAAFLSSFSVFILPENNLH
jgi:OCT family organic cation transporter-like MFS transporter 4/5